MLLLYNNKVHQEDPQIPEELVQTKIRPADPVGDVRNVARSGMQKRGTLELEEEPVDQEDLVPTRKNFNAGPPPIKPFGPSFMKLREQREREELQAKARVRTWGEWFRLLMKELQLGIPMDVIEQNEQGKDAWVVVNGEKLLVRGDPQPAPKVLSETDKMVKQLDFGLQNLKGCASVEQVARFIKTFKKPHEKPVISLHIPKGMDESSFNWDYKLQQKNNLIKLSIMKQKRAA